MKMHVWASLALGLLAGVGLVSGCDHPRRSSINDAAAGSASVMACTRTSECVNQVCSPDGRCVNCYSDVDCRADQRCDQEQCVARDGSNGGAGGNGGSSGAAAGTGGDQATGGSGGSGGSGNPGTCGGAKVLFVVQRSGAMFELPAPEASYWSMVSEALVGAEGAAAAFDDKLDMGALFFVRLQTANDQPACPLTSVVGAAIPSVAALAAAFDDNATQHATLVAMEGNKLDAPVPEAVAAAAALLGSGGHIVLITTAVPDTCELADSNCSVDPTIKALQDAQGQGVTTHVIGLGDTPNLDSFTGNDQGYEQFLSLLANAGSNQPVASNEMLQLACPDQNSATYADDSGSAQAFQADSAEEVKTAVQQILSEICPG